MDLFSSLVLFVMDCCSLLCLIRQDFQSMGCGWVRVKVRVRVGVRVQYGIGVGVRVESKAMHGACLGWGVWGASFGSSAVLSMGWLEKTNLGSLGAGAGVGVELSETSWTKQSPRVSVGVGARLGFE